MAHGSPRTQEISQLSAAKGLRSTARNPHSAAGAKVANRAYMSQLRERLDAEIPPEITDQADRQRRIDALVKAHFAELGARGAKAKRKIAEGQAELHAVAVESAKLTDDPTTTG